MVRSCLRRSLRLAGSRPTVGSSMSSRRGWCSSARASSTRRRLPPLNCALLSWARSLRPRRASSSSIRGRAIARGMPCSPAWNSRLAVTESSRSRVGCWNTMPSRASAGTGLRDMSWPITSMRPEFGREQAGEQLEQGRLAGSVGSEQGDEFAGMGAKADAVDRPDRPVGLDDIVQAAARAARLPPARSSITIPPRPYASLRLARPRPGRTQARACALRRLSSLSGYRCLPERSDQALRWRATRGRRKRQERPPVLCLRRLVLRRLLVPLAAALALAPVRRPGRQGYRPHLRQQREDQQHHRHRSQDLPRSSRTSRSRAGRATCISAPTTPSSMSPAATTT